MEGNIIERTYKGGMTALEERYDSFISIDGVDVKILGPSNPTQSN